MAVSVGDFSLSRYRVIRKVPLYLLFKTYSRNLFVFYYHMVSDQEISHLKNCYSFKNTESFLNDLQYLLDNFEIISFENLLDDPDRKFQNPSFLLTFDDGFQQMYEISKILKRKSVPGVFFINPPMIDNRNLCHTQKSTLLHNFFIKKGIKLEEINEVLRSINPELKLDENSRGFFEWSWVRTNVLDNIAAQFGLDFNKYLKKYRPYLTSDQIKEMISDGFIFGGHSNDHPFYHEISIEDQLTQTVSSTDWVVNKFNLDYKIFAFPHGDAGVNKSFFDEVFNRYGLDLVFGTGGLDWHLHRKNIQRISLEKPLLPADAIVKYELVKQCYKKWHID